MKPLKRLSVIEQSATHLRDSINNGVWTGKLPGVVRLAEELGVSKLTMRAAIRILEDEDLITLSENGYSRYVTQQHNKSNNVSKVRVGIMMAEPLAEEAGPTQKIIYDILQQLEGSGLEPFVYKEDLKSIRHDIKRLETIIAGSPADIHIIVAGSLEVIEWFSQQDQPCIALFGRTGDVPIARVGIDKSAATEEVLTRLIKSGHKRIVKLTRKERRLPSLGLAERHFIEVLVRHGIETSTYNLPDWEETPEGLSNLLEGLFKLTPPTAIFTDETAIWIAVQQFLAQNKILVPEDVSVIASDYDPLFSWCYRMPSHFSWQGSLLVRHIVKWVTGIKSGKVDHKKKLHPAEFVAGGTIGPAAK